MSDRLVPCLLICALLSGFPAWEQTKDVKKGLAIEFLTDLNAQPQYAILSQDGKDVKVYIQSLRRLNGAEIHGSSSTTPSTLEFTYKMNDRKVIITAVAVFGSPEKDGSSEPLVKSSRQELGTYSLALSESVTLYELEKFELEPIKLKIVTAQPEVSNRPGTMTHVPSLQIEIVGEDRVSYDVVLRNTSSRGVTAVLVDMPNGQNVTGRQDGDGSSLVIPPGKTHHLSFGVGSSGRVTPGGFLPDPPPPLMIVEGALFEDGTSEGDPSVVAGMKAAVPNK